MDNRKSRRLKGETRQEKLMEGSDIEPITRMEQFLSRQAKRSRDYGLYIMSHPYYFSFTHFTPILIRSKEMTKDEMQNFVGKGKCLIPYYYTDNGKWQKLFGWELFNGGTEIRNLMSIMKSDFEYNERNNTYRLKKIVRFSRLFFLYARQNGRAGADFMSEAVNCKGFSADKQGHGLGGTLVRDGSSYKWMPKESSHVKVIDSSYSSPVYVDNRHARSFDNAVCSKLIKSTDFEYLRPLFYSTYTKYRGLNYNKMVLRFKVATMGNHELNSEGYYCEDNKRVYWDFKMTDFIKNEVFFKKHLPLIKKSSEGAVIEKVYVIYGYVREK